MSIENLENNRFWSAFLFQKGLANASILYCNKINNKTNHRQYKVVFWGRCMAFGVPSVMQPSSYRIGGGEKKGNLSSEG